MGCVVSEALANSSKVLFGSAKAGGCLSPQELYNAQGTNTCFSNSQGQKFRVYPILLDLSTWRPSPNHDK